MYQPRIAIIGGGPAGLTLGRLLHLRGIQTTIYDLRAKPTAEELDQPCGMLDLHEESGLSAIRECGLWDEFMTLTGECSEETKVYDSEAKLLHQDFGGSAEGARPEISRHQLLKLLMSSIPADMVRWEHKVTSIERRVTETGSTEIIVDFGLKGKASFDLVVGADGAWSKFRALLTPTKPHYSGIQFISLDLKAVSTRHPRFAEFLGNGSMMSLGFHNGVLAQRGARGAARMYLAVSTKDEDFGGKYGLKDKVPADAKATLLNDQDLFAKWNPIFKELIAAACEESTEDDPTELLDVKPLYMLPVGHRWESGPGLTLVGDAAHLMTPFAGEGVNLAMWDCQDLATAIGDAVEAGAAGPTEFHSLLQPLIKQYETAMLDRAGEKAEETWSNKGMMFDTLDSSRNLAEFFQSAGLGPEQPS